MTATNSRQAPADQVGAAYHNMTDKLGHLGLDTAVPEGVRALAEKAVAQTRQAYDRSRDAFDASLTTSRVLDAAGQGAAAFNRKIVDMPAEISMLASTWPRAWRGQEPRRIVELQSAFWRKQFGILTSQAEEVRALSMKVTQDAVSRSRRKWHAATGGRTEFMPLARRGYRLFPGAGENEMNVATILKHKGSGVFTTTSDKSLLDIAKLLQQHGVGCIVVVRDDKIAGIVSERDLMRAVGQAGPKVLEQPVSDFMTKTVITAQEADTADQLMAEMTTRRFRHMPVVEERDRLIGLVSIGDLVKIHIAEIEMEAAATREYTA